jgi:hypothetical protein
MGTPKQGKKGNVPMRTKAYDSWIILDSWKSMTTLISNIWLVLLFYGNAITTYMSFFNHLCLHCDGYGGSLKDHIEFMHINNIGCMHKWMDQFGCRVSQLCLMVAIVMPMLLYRTWNLFKWTWFKDLNLIIYLMHKIVL